MSRVAISISMGAQLASAVKVAADDQKIVLAEKTPDFSEADTELGSSSSNHSDMIDRGSYNHSENRDRVESAIMPDHMLAGPSEADFKEDGQLYDLISNLDFEVPSDSGSFEWVEGKDGKCSDSDRIKFVEEYHTKLNSLQEEKIAYFYAMAGRCKLPFEYYEDRKIEDFYTRPNVQTAPKDADTCWYLTRTEQWVRKQLATMETKYHKENYALCFSKLGAEDDKAWHRMFSMLQEHRSIEENKHVLDLFKNLFEDELRIKEEEFLKLIKKPITILRSIDKERYPRRKLQLFEDALSKFTKILSDHGDKVNKKFGAGEYLTAVFFLIVHANMPNFHSNFLYLAGLQQAESNKRIGNSKNTRGLGFYEQAIDLFKPSVDVWPQAEAHLRAAKEFEQQYTNTFDELQKQANKQAGEIRDLKIRGFTMKTDMPHKVSAVVQTYEDFNDIVKKSDSMDVQQRLLSNLISSKKFADLKQATEENQMNIIVLAQAFSFDQEINKLRDIVIRNDLHANRTGIFMKKKKNVLEKFDDLQQEFNNGSKPTNKMNAKKDRYCNKIDKVASASDAVFDLLNRDNNSAWLQWTAAYKSVAGKSSAGVFFPAGHQISNYGEFKIQMLARINAWKNASNDAICKKEERVPKLSKRKSVMSMRFALNDDVVAKSLQRYDSMELESMGSMGNMEPLHMENSSKHAEM